MTTEINTLPTITATIREYNQSCDTEESGPASYKALAINTTKGVAVATVTGPGEIVKSWSADMWRLEDGTYALRDILTFARRGARGLSIVG